MTRLATRKLAAYRRGVFAEEICAWFLRLKGYRVIGQRIRTAAGEIDILASKGDTLVIVEVKARGTFREGMESITAHKRERLAGAALAALASEGKMTKLGRKVHSGVRFDVMVVSPGHLPRHVTDAWRL